MGSEVIFRGQSIVFVVPGPIATRTGGYIYDSYIIDGLRALGAAVRVLELEGTFPFPSNAALTDATRALSSIPDRTIVIIDGLALGAMHRIVEIEAERLRIVALVHLPLGADITMDRQASARLAEQERRALATTRAIVVTSEATVAMLAAYDLPRDRIVVIEPGTERPPLAHGSAGPLLQLLCVATVNAGKGHELLLRALARTSVDNWRLACAGSLDRDPPCVERVRAAIVSLGLDDRVSLVGDLDAAALAGCYAAADLFVLATLQETYGMAVAEALSYGLPVVSTTTGAIPRLVGDEAGLVVPPGDIDALQDALSRVLGDAALRHRLAVGARGVRDRLVPWEHAVAQFGDVLSRLP